MIRRIHQLNLSYEEYRKLGKSIANSKIGKYVVYQQIGKGAYGAVYKGMNDQTKSVVAIKVLDIEAIQLQPSQRIKQIRRRLCRTESQLMMLCNGDNLIKCFDTYESKSLKIMVIEYCNGGTLQQQIDTKFKIPEKEAILILKQIINGIAELHSHKIVHRDLKAENILSHNGIYKIADFGFSKEIDPGAEIRMTTLGTITTMAPEVMKKQPYGLKADIWSIGIIFFQMIFGKVPYTSTNAHKLYEEIKTKKILDQQTFTCNGYTASKEVTQFLRQILVIESDKRLGWKQLVAHELFKETNGELDNQFRFNFVLIVPKNTENLQKQMIGGGQDLVFHFKQQNLEVNPQQLIRITQVQANQKKKQIKTQEDALYEWVKLTHLECLKTELIYHQIIDSIEKNKLIDLCQRDSIEFLYLLATRCLNNISIINDKLEKEKNVYVVKNLLETVKLLYQRIQNTWKTYSLKLTEVEDRVISMISDRFMKIFKSESIREKDRFLVGIQTSEYSKEEQIHFTDLCYIQRLKVDLKENGSPAAMKVFSYLSHYVEINSIKLQDLKQRFFKQYVSMIIQ